MAEPDDQGVFSADTVEVQQGVTANLAALAAAVAGGLYARALDVVRVVDSVGVARIPVQSSCISVLSYHVESGDLEVTFHDGSVYHYPAVHMADFVKFLNAPSKGKHYNAYWRGKEKLIQGKKKGSHMILGGSR